MTDADMELNEVENGEKSIGPTTLARIWILDSLRKLGSVAGVPET